MKNFVKIQPIDKPYLTILWQVNNWCNFKCSYCNSYSNGGDYKNNHKVKKSIEIFESIITSYQEQGIENFFLKITGGEPSMWKGTVSVVEKFNQLVPKDKRKVSLNTNLSRELDWWEKYYTLFDIVIGSYHSEFTDTEHYINVTKFLQDKVFLKSKIMMNKNSFEQCVSVANKIKNVCDNYRIEYTPVLASLTSEVEPYYYEDPDHIDFFKTHTNDNKTTKVEKKDLFEKICVTENNSRIRYTDNQIIVARKNNFTGWKCNVFENLFISRDGTIFQSTCGQGKNIGNIFEGLYNKKLESTICKKEWCHCGVDIMNTKEVVQ